VTVDKYGLITVSGTAQLNDVNNITVQAAYHGKVYEAVFGVTKARGGAPGRGILSIVSWYYRSDSATTLIGGYWTTIVPARTNGKYIWQKTVTTYTDGTISETDPVCISGEQGADSGRYRGVTNTADTGNTGVVTLVSGGEAIMNDLDWVLFMGTTDWTKARLYQWHAVERVWTVMEPAQNMSHYMDVLETITENAADGIFSNVFCRVLFAQQAAIATLESQIIKIANAIYGGDRYNADGSDNDVNVPGFWLGGNGILKAVGGIFSGVSIKSGYGVDNPPSGGTLLRSISGYAQTTVVLNSGWYYVDMAGAGGGNGGNFYKTEPRIAGGSGGKTKYMFNIQYEGIIAYLYSGSRGSNGSDDGIGEAPAGSGWSINIYNSGDIGGQPGSVSWGSYSRSYGGRGASFNANDAENGRPAGGYNNGSGGGGGGNSILYIPSIGLILFCSGGGGGAGSGDNGIGTMGKRGNDSILGNINYGINEDGYVNIYRI
jgi:hypothetical protein